MSEVTPLLQITDMVKSFEIKSSKGFRTIRQELQAVAGVSLDVHGTETVGLVGESGSGKSTLGRCVLQLLKPTSGSVKFKGTELTTLDRKSLRELRRDMQIVFQDPFASLDPRLTVGQAIAEPLVVTGIKGKHDDRVAELLELVGLSPEHRKRFPHEFSGGQRQRIGVARALCLNPDLIILDEPVSALDVSIQAGVVNLLQDLQQEFGIGYIFIAHDLSVVRHISDRIAVMYLGKLMEVADRTALYETPAHPYTHALLSAVPQPDPKIERGRERVVLEGDLPSPASPPTGCRFHTRCPIAQEQCKVEEPQLVEIRTGHRVACHFPLLPGQDLLDMMRDKEPVSQT